MNVFLFFKAGLTVPSTVQLSKQKIVVKRLKTKLNLLPSPTSPPPPPLQNQPPSPPPVQISKNYRMLSQKADFHCVNIALLQLQAEISFAIY